MLHIKYDAFFCGISLSLKVQEMYLNIWGKFSFVAEIRVDGNLWVRTVV